MSSNRILFLLKQSDTYGNYSSNTSKSGLLNSAKLTAGQITKYLGIPTQVDICVDGNEVDKYVTAYKPTVCIIEAIWVTPIKFTELIKIHTTVQFIVLVHSSVAFLSNEGMAITWLRQYPNIKNVTVAFNSFGTSNEFAEIGVSNIYLPNVYCDVSMMQVPKPYIKGNPLSVGCFGAIRPFKNQLIQAFAAIILAEKLNSHLLFNINSTRPEQGGEPTLKNIRALFSGRSNCALVEHDWSDREQFLALVSTMDIGMQVSFSETFNIIAADFVLELVPIIVSSEIWWMPDTQQASLYSTDDMVSKMLYGLNHQSSVIKKNIKAITKYNSNSLAIWNSYLKTIN